MATLLGFMLPSAYIGGKTIGSELLNYNKEAGESMLQSKLAREFMHPWRSDAVQNLVKDPNVYILLRIFLYVAIPAFILIMFAAENYARKEYKDLKKNRVYRIGRRLMLSSGFILIIWSIVAIIDLIAAKRFLFEFRSGGNFASGFLYGMNLTLTIVHIILHFVIGLMGYMLWKNPTKKNIKIAFVMGMVLLGVTVFSLVFSNVSVISRDNILVTIDNIEILIITLMYVAGAIIVRANYKLGLLKPRD